MAGGLFGQAVTTPELAEAVSDAAWLRALLRFESGLASAEAALGVIPTAAAEAIEARCASVEIDPAAIGLAAVASATPVVPLLAVLRDGLPEEAARHLHHGATSQDAIDTAAMLVTRDSLDVILAELDGLADECAGLAERHAGTVMAGRTLMQRARPTSFGLKAAGWLVAVLEARAALRGFRRARLAVQLGGSSGSLDVLGLRGLAVAEELARRLGLALPVAPWHSDRTRIGELAGALALAGGAAAKIALDVVLLAQTEVGEVQVGEPGRSSAMPEKRNPARAVEARAAQARLLGAVSILLGGLAGEQERAAGAWQAEWATLGEALSLAGGAVARARESLQGLKVDEARMREHAGGESAPEAAGELVARVLRKYREEVAG